MSVHCLASTTLGARGGDTSKGELRCSRVVGDVGVKGTAMGLRDFGLGVVAGYASRFGGLGLGGLVVVVIGALPLGHGEQQWGYSTQMEVR